MVATLLIYQYLILDLINFYLVFKSETQDPHCHILLNFLRCNFLLESGIEEIKQTETFFTC